tara:strand:- start:131 stop:289 length:159 start_codon:yes stop_codon:yes gene_type:complete
MVVEAEVVPVVQVALDQDPKQVLVVLVYHQILMEALPLELLVDLEVLPTVVL